MIRIRSRSPLVSLALSRSRGLRQLCSLWFEYDLCLNRKPSSDHINFGIASIKRVTTAMFSLVWIRPMFEQESPKWPWEVFNDPDSNTIQVGPKGVKLWFGYDQEAPKWVWPWADQEGYDSYVLFGSNTTYVWTGSPQVTMIIAARFEYDHKPDQKRLDLIQIWSAP